MSKIADGAAQPAKRERPEPKRLKLTQDRVKALELPTGTATTYWDTELRGFGVRVSPKGRKTWVAQYRIKGTNQEVLETIGTADVIRNVDDARKLARKSMHTALEGINPVEERKKAAEAKKAAAEADAFTVAKLRDEFIRRHHVRNRRRASTIYETRRLLNRAVAVLGEEKPASAITKADILALVNDLADTRLRVWRGNESGSLSEANGVLRTLRAAYRWAVANDLVSVDPTVGVRSPLSRLGERERVLSDQEVVAFWAGCDSLGWPFGRVFQLLLLTGQRLREVGEVNWSEFDLDNAIWHLPGHRTKNGHAHEVHLSDLSLEIIKALPHLKGLVFSLRGDKALAGYSDAKLRLDKFLAQASPHMEPWTLHDLRRTAATGMARLNFPPHVVDKLLNHVSGSIRGVAAIYNRHSYLDERKAALNAWGRFVENLVNPAPSNVVEIAATR